MTTKSTRVLVIDDDPLQLELVKRSLATDDFEVATIQSPIGVSNVVRSFVPDIVLLDVNIPGLSGDRLLELARRHAPDSTRFILWSACDEIELRVLAMKVSAHGWIPKSVPIHELGKRLHAFHKRTPYFLGRRPVPD